MVQLLQGLEIGNEVKINTIISIVIGIVKLKKRIWGFLKYISIEHINTEMHACLERCWALCVVSLPCRWQQHSRLEMFFYILSALAQSIFLQKVFVEEKRLKVYRQISLCPHISLKHYFKVVLKWFP